MQPCVQLREKYIKDEDMSDTKATYQTIHKALATLDDPFTRFLEPPQFAALRRGTAGSVTGVGLEIGFETHANDSQLVVRHMHYCASDLVHLNVIVFLTPCSLLINGSSQGEAMSPVPHCRALLALP